MKSKKIEWPRSGILQVMESVGVEGRLHTPQEFCFNGAVRGRWVWVGKMAEGGEEVEASSYTINKSQR